MGRRTPLFAAFILLSSLFTALPAMTANAAERVTTMVRIPMSDGVTLRAAVSGAGELIQRPTIVEFTPYAHTGASYQPTDAYNRVVVEIRGTGDSDGRFDALGPRSKLLHRRNRALGDAVERGRLGGSDAMGLPAGDVGVGVPAGRGR